MVLVLEFGVVWVKGRRDCRNGRFRDRDVTEKGPTNGRYVIVMLNRLLTLETRLPLRDTGVRCGP